MDNLRLAIGTPGEIAQGATVIPRVVLLLQVLSLPWNQCPLGRGKRRESALASYLPLFVGLRWRTGGLVCLRRRLRQETCGVTP